MVGAGRPGGHREPWSGMRPTGAGAELAVVIYPYAHQIVDPLAGDAPQRVLRHHLEALDVPYLDLLGSQRLRTLPIRELFVDANHFTSAGSDLVARETADFLRTMDPPLVR